MKCHWTARAEIAVAVPLLLCGVIILRSRRKESWRQQAVMSMVLGVFVVLLPTVLIGVCAKPDMVCRALMKPMLTLGGHPRGGARSALLPAGRPAKRVNQMNVARLIYRNVTRNGFRSGVVFSCALLLAALPFGVTFITEGGRASLQVVLGRLGADLLIVPEGAEIKVETALLMGKPAPVWMPAENLARIARMPGVAQAFTPTPPGDSGGRLVLFGFGNVHRGV